MKKLRGKSGPSKCATCELTVANFLFYSPHGRETKALHVAGAYYLYSLKQLYNFKFSELMANAQLYSRSLD
jgi:hypothetical protein